eukprot:6424778-Amphidinium_carterae.1
MQLVVEGVCEGMPSFVLQVYAALLYNSYSRMCMLEMTIAVMSMVLSLKSAATAANHLNLSRRFASRSTGGMVALVWRMMDEAGRLGTWAVLAVALRPSKAPLSEPHQKILGAVLLVDTMLHVLLTEAALRLTSTSQQRDQHEQLSLFLVLFTGTPMRTVPWGRDFNSKRAVRFLVMVLHLVTVGGTT